MRRPSFCDALDRCARWRSRRRSARRRPTPVGARYSPNFAQGRPHSPVVTPAFGGGDRRFHDGAAFARGRRSAMAFATALVALARHASGDDLLASTCFRNDHDRPRCQRRGSVSVKRLTPTTVCSPGSMADAGCSTPPALLHVTRVDGGDRAAAAVDGGELISAIASLQFLDLA